MKTLFNRLLPFIMPGILIVVFIAGMVIFSYLLFWGVLVGLVLFAVSWIKRTFFSTKSPIDQAEKPRRGRIIEHKE
jgi:hypothetical protein